MKTITMTKVQRRSNSVLEIQALGDEAVLLERGYEVMNRSVTLAATHLQEVADQVKSISVLLRYAPGEERLAITQDALSAVLDSISRVSQTMGIVSVLSEEHSEAVGRVSRYVRTIGKSRASRK